MTVIEAAIWISNVAVSSGIVFLFRSRELALRRRVTGEIGELRDNVQAQIDRLAQPSAMPLALDCGYSHADSLSPGESELLASVAAGPPKSLNAASSS